MLAGRLGRLGRDDPPLLGPLGLLGASGASGEKVTWPRAATPDSVEPCPAFSHGFAIISWGSTLPSHRTHYYRVLLTHTRTHIMRACVPWGRETVPAILMPCETTYKHPKTAASARVPKPAAHPRKGHHEARDSPTFHGFWAERPTAMAPIHTCHTPPGDAGRSQTPSGPPSPLKQHIYRAPGGS